MISSEQLHLADLPDRVRDVICDEIAEYTVGLQRTFPSDSGEKLWLIGTGTLVSVSGLHCVLTAEHVLRELGPADGLGLLTSFSGDLRRHVFEQRHLRLHRIARGTDDSHGPDVGLIVLPSSNIGFLRAQKSFYNLDKRIARFNGQFLPKEMGFWFSCGVLGETATDVQPERGFGSIRGYQGLCGASANPREEVEDEFDYLEVRVPYFPDTVSDLPNSFGGFSGGGLWQVPCRRNANGEVEHEELILSGITFYQTPVENGIRLLRCHGRRTVHEVVIRYLEAHGSGP